MPTTPIGQSVPRIDGRDKVRGSSAYAANLELPGMAVAGVLRSPVPHARVLSVDASAARRMRGVYAVLTGADILSAGFEPCYGSLVRDQPILAFDRVRYIGDPVAAVAAADLDTAEEALDSIQVEYEELPAVFTLDEALAAGAPLLHDRISNVLSHFKIRRGDVARGFADADLVFEDEFYSPPSQHCHLEPYACLALVAPDGSIDCWSSTQTPSSVRATLAETFRLPLSKVRVRVPPVGGGYGAKCYAKIEPLTVALARAAGRPVRLVLTREECFLTLTRHAARARIRTGVRRDGAIVAREITVHYDAGAYADVSPRVSKNGCYPGVGPYRVPHLKLDSFAVYTNKVPAGAYRGYGVGQLAWGIERQMDRIAAELGIDPLEMRLRNALREGDPSHTGQRVEGMPVVELLQRVAAEIGWADRARRRAAADAESSGRLRRGFGIACSIKGTGTPSVSNAVVRLDHDGSATLLTSTVEIGQGAETALVQIAAEALGLPLDRVRAVQPDTAVTPYDRSTSSSRSVFMMGNAILAAAAEIKEQVFAVAADALEVAPADLELADGRVFVKGSPNRGLDLSEVFQRRFGSGGGSFVGRGAYHADGGLDPETGQGRATAFWQSSAAACEVEVDVETGQVRVVRYVNAANAGRVINPAACEGQIEGAVLAGIGQTLYEQTLFENGQPVNPNLLDYGLPSICETPPQLQSVLAEHPHPHGPFGAVGVGESALPAVSACIANAVFDAVGVAVHELPLTPERVLAGMRAAATAAGPPR